MPKSSMLSAGREALSSSGLAVSPPAPSAEPAGNAEISPGCISSAQSSKRRWVENLEDRNWLSGLDCTGCPGEAQQVLPRAMGLGHKQHFQHCPVKAEAFFLPVNHSRPQKHLRRASLEQVQWQGTARGKRHNQGALDAQEHARLRFSEIRDSRGRR